METCQCVLAGQADWKISVRRCADIDPLDIGAAAASLVEANLARTHWARAIIKYFGHDGVALNRTPNIVISSRSVTLWMVAVGRCPG